MPLTPPPSAPPPAPDAPGAAPSRANPNTFRALADAFVVWLVGFRDSLADLRDWMAGYVSWATTHVGELNALQVEVNAAADAVAGVAEDAATASAAAASAAVFNDTGRVFTAAEGTAAALADAGITTGQRFAVIDASGLAYTIYRKDAGPAATPVARNILLDMQGDDTADYLAVLKDLNGRALWRVDSDGSFVAKFGMATGIANGLTLTRNPTTGRYTLSLGTVEGELPLGGSLLRGSYDNPDYLFVLTDLNDRALLRIGLDGTVLGKISSTEVTSARGTRTDLSTRLSQYLTPYGLPKRHMYGEWYLRETRQRLRKRLLGEPAQLVIATIGDSWTHAATRWTGPTAASLKTIYGDAGPGWTGFAWGFGGASNVWSGGNGNVNTTEVTVALSAGWTTNYASSPGPDLGEIVTSTVAEKVTVGFAGTGNISGVDLFYNAGGSVRYRFNAGAWTTIDTSVAGIAALSGVPTGTWSLEVENVSGTTKLHGVNLKKSTDGVRWHKLGATGSSTTSWTSPNAAAWQANLTALAPNYVEIMHGTNDQQTSAPSGVSPAQFDTNLRALIARVRAAVPLADIFVVMPCENGRATITQPMSLYAEKAYVAAADLKCAFADLQYDFGESYAEYGDTSARNWFNPDKTHPEPLTGGRVIVDLHMRVITNY